MKAIVQTRYGPPELLRLEEIEKRYDLIFAVNGYHSILDYNRALKPGGLYVTAGGSSSQIFQALLLGPLFS